MTRARGVLAGVLLVVLVGAAATLLLVHHEPAHEPAQRRAAASGECRTPVLTTSADRTWRSQGYAVDQDLWNNHSGTQVLRTCSYRSWTVTATQPDTAEDPDVNSYPDVWRAFPASRLDSFSEITSRFATHGPGAGVYDFTYDVWIDGIADDHAIEVMVWTGNHGNQPHVPRRGTLTSEGVPYDVYRAGRFIAFLAPPRDRGRVDLLALFRYAESRGWLAGSSTIRRIEFGVEICKTGGRPLEFAVTDYDLTTG